MFSQGSGRNSDDGLTSYSRIYYRAPSAHHDVYDYCTTEACRRVFIAKHFEELTSDCIYMCDNCVAKK